MDLIRMLKGRGTPVILISHNMQDVFEISDRIFVMRRGSKAGDFITARTEPNEVVRTMIGG
jgi:simple sugar transport system ATP-binding protein